MALVRVLLFFCSLAAVTGPAQASLFKTHAVDLACSNALQPIDLRVARQLLEPYITHFVTFKLRTPKPRFLSGVFDGFDLQEKIRLLDPKGKLQLLDLDQIDPRDVRLGLSRPDLHSERQAVVFGVGRAKWVGTVIGFSSIGEIELREEGVESSRYLPRGARLMGRLDQLLERRMRRADFRRISALLENEIGNWIELEVKTFFWPFQKHFITGVFRGFDWEGNLLVRVSHESVQKIESVKVVHVWTTQAIRDLGTSDLVPLFLNERAVGARILGVTAQGRVVADVEGRELELSFRDLGNQSLTHFKFKTLRNWDYQEHGMGSFYDDDEDLDLTLHAGFLLQATGGDHVMFSVTWEGRSVIVVGLAVEGGFFVARDLELGRWIMIPRIKRSETVHAP